MNTLGKSVDETASVVHLILSSLLKDHHQHIGLCKKSSSLLVVPIKQSYTLYVKGCGSGQE